MIRKLRILKSDFIGVYCRVSDNRAIVPYAIESEVSDQIRDYFSVEVIHVHGETPLVGSLIAMNSQCLVAPEGFLNGSVKNGGITVVTLREKLNAMGNNIVMNDRAAIVHKEFSTRSVKKLEDDLDMEVIRSSIGGVKTVGSVSVLTGKGMLVTPTIRDDEVDFLKNYFKVPVNSGTANFGSIYVGTSILANRHAIAVGESTTPIEIGRIDDTLS